MKPCQKKLLKESVKGRISFNERLKDHTTFKIGGKVLVWVEPSSLEDLISALRIFYKAGLNPLVIGNGSNILAYDGRVDRAVIKLSAPYFKKSEFGKSYVVCSSGHSLTALIAKCIKKGLSGLEGLAGIPGTVGGAIAVNAGGSGSNNIGEMVEWVRVIDCEGKKISLLKKDKIRFDYRDSDISKYIVLEAKFALRKSAPEMVQKRYSEFLKEKKIKQEYRYPNAGCIFKNPRNTKLTSGRVLELCGFKGMRVKGAEVSTKHANFIINKGRARFDDIVSLMKLEQDVVKSIYGIRLEPEIKIIK